MADAKQTTRFRFWRWLIRFIGMIVPRRFRTRWRREWEAELEYREELLARWDRLDWRNKLKLLWRSLGAFWDALWLQRQRWEDEMIQDLRFGVRMLLKHKGFTLIAILTLALGIGANTAIFSVANAMLLQPLPIKNADRLVIVNVYGSYPGFSYPDYLELRKQSNAVVDLFGSSPVELLLGASGSEAMVDSEAEELRGMLVTGTYFSALGGKAALGRTLTLQDDQVGAPAPVAVLSHRFWQRRFGAAPDIVGQTILLNGRGFTVVGVAEENFTGVRRTAPDLWVPLLMRDQLNPQDKMLIQRYEISISSSHMMGELRPGVTLKQAEAALTMAFSQLKQDDPSFAPNLHRQIRLSPVTMMSLEGPQLSQTITTVASVALAAVTLVLLIACLNVAGLMLARMAARQREIAVRLSLGASRLRLLRQLFTESLLLAGAGGLAGLLLSRWMAQALGILIDPGVFKRGVTLDWRVLIYTLGISTFTAVVVGLAPAWQATRFDLIPALKQEGAGFNLRAPRLPLRSMLVVGQIALSLVLLLGAGLFARTLLHLGTINYGFETKNLSVVDFRRSPGSTGYDETRAFQFQQALEERLLAAPMVKDVVWVRRLPIRFLYDDDPGKSILYGPDASAFEVATNGMVIAKRGMADVAAHNVVTPNYFAALGIPLLYGRTFAEQEIRDDKTVVIINEELARRHWQGENPVGKSLWVNDGVKEIVGVVKDHTLPNAANEPYLYLPARLKDRRGLRLLVKSDTNSDAVAATLRATIRSLDPKLKIIVRQYEDALKDMFRPLWLGASLSSLAGLLALALAVMGLYGVTAFMVVQRTREIGVRIALGAQAADVVRLVLRQGLLLVIIGVALGLLISLAATRVLAAALYGISPTDPLTFGSITLLLGLVALLACWIPARRATRVDPLVALRHE
jgi:predicted permease